MEVHTIKYWKGQLVEDTTVEVPDDVKYLENANVVMGDFSADCPYCKKTMDQWEITDPSENECEKITDHYYKHLACGGVFKTWF